MGNAATSFYRNIAGKNTTNIANAYSTVIWICQSTRSLKLEGLKINSDVFSGVLGGEVNIAPGVKCTSTQLPPGEVQEFQRTKGKEHFTIFDVSGKLLVQRGISANQSYIVTESGSFMRQKEDSENPFEDIHGIVHNMSHFHFNVTHIANASEFDIWVGMSQETDVNSELKGILKVPAGEFHRYRRLNAHELMTIKDEEGKELVSTYPIGKNISYIFTKKGGLVEQKYGCSNLFEDMYGRIHGADDGITKIMNTYKTDIYTSLSSPSRASSEMNLTRIQPGGFTSYIRYMGVNMLKILDDEYNVVISTTISPNASYIMTKKKKLVQQMYGNEDIFTDINNCTHAIIE